MSKNQTKMELDLSIETLERHVSAIKTYISSGEFRLARQSLAIAERTISRINSLTREYESEN